MPIKTDNTYNIDKKFDYFAVKAMVKESLEKIILAAKQEKEQEQGQQQHSITFDYKVLAGYRHHIRSHPGHENDSPPPRREPTENRGGYGRRYRGGGASSRGEERIGKEWLKNLKLTRLTE